MAVTLGFAMLGTDAATAHSQDAQVQVDQARIYPDSNTTKPADIAVQPLRDAAPDPAIADEGDIALPSAATLAELVDMVPVPAHLSSDIACLASAIYFEAKSESLAGQLAVGRVIVARTASGQFPSSYCGVVLQHAQFSFVHRGALPVINRSSALWQQVVKVAVIAHRGAWKSPAEGALFFHAAHVRPAGRKVRVAQVDHQIFYR